MARKSSLSPTLEVIARKLGISRATASRAIRNADGIHSETRTRVLETAKELGYVTPQSRNSDNTRRIHQVMVLSQSNAQGEERQYLAGISRTSIPLKIVILAHHLTTEECLKIMKPKHQPMAMQEGMVDGLVLLRSWPAEIVAQLSARWPTVSVVHHYPDSTADCAGIDDRSGMALIVHHLLRGGHRKIGFFGLCHEVSWSCSRYAGYLEALTRARLPYHPNDVVEIEPSEALSNDAFTDSGWAEKILSRLRNGVDAWVCSNMGSAWALSQCFLDRGIRIPDDVAVTGYHTKKADPVSLPTVTATEMLDEELGAAALRMLIHRFEYPRDATQTLLLSPPLLVRASTRAEQSRS